MKNLCIGILICLINLSCEIEVAPFNLDVSNQTVINSILEVAKHPKIYAGHYINPTDSVDCTIFYNTTINKFWNASAIWLFNANRLKSISNIKHEILYHSTRDEAGNSNL